MHIQGSDPYQQKNEDRTRKAADTERAVVADMAIVGGRRALAYVRTHAADYGIDPKRIGIIGFSAGGVISVDLPPITPLPTIAPILLGSCSAE